METYIAYKCDYCDKIFMKSNACRSHEYKCYYNPKTKSCASCAFLILETKYFKVGCFTKYQACIVNTDIPKKGLQTKCDKYLDKKYSNDNEMMSLVKSSYEDSVQWASVKKKFGY